jgi:prepilin-type N-terminal cleavage/methylation domain-containing protein
VKEFVQRITRNRKLRLPAVDGFTMGEMVIVIAVIAILAALITPLAVNQVTQARYDACREELLIIKQAIVGDPSLVEGGVRSSYGFVGDLGVFPLNLNELVTNTTGRPIWQAGPSGMYFGWRGPYVSEIKDPWGNYYFYTTNFPAGPLPYSFQSLSSPIATIWSSGPDGNNDGGTNDDASITIGPDEAFSIISGNTLDEDLVSVQYQTITLSYPDGDATIAQSSLNPPPQFRYSFTFAVPIGIRRLDYITDDGTNGWKLISINNGPMTTVNLIDNTN